jgi:hypothetical protein
MRIDKEGRDVTNMPGLWSDGDAEGLSVGELIELLKKFDPNLPVLFTYRGESELLTKDDISEELGTPPRPGGYVDGHFDAPRIRYLEIGS